MSRTLAFGQPPGALMQFAYTVPSIERAMPEWSRRLGIGPFAILEGSLLEDARYYGAPSDIDLRAALVFSGSMCIELIEQINDVPSVYRDAIEARGYGFHHWAVSTADFDSEVARREAEGLRVAFSGRVTVGGRFAYIDTNAALGGMIELIEMNEAVEAFFTRLRDAAATWDGRELVLQL